MRRGQFQMQFQWIFALVGGALFLLFFFLVIRSVVTQGVEAEERELSFAAETVLSTSITNPETFTVHRLPRSAVFLFGCEYSKSAGRFVESYVRIEEQSFNPQNLRPLPVFSLPRVEGDELYTLSSTWEVPYPSARLLYTANNRTRFIFVTQTSQASANRVRQLILEQNLDGFGTQIVTQVDVGSLEARGEDEYRLVLWNVNYEDVLSQLDQSFLNLGTMLLVAGDARTGNMTFIDDLTNVSLSEEYPYWGSAMLVAGIFSDEELFACNMRKAYGRLLAMTRILRNRTAALAPSYPDCEGDYQDSLSALLQYEGRVAAFLESPNPAYTVPRTIALGDEGPIRELQRNNIDLRRKDCPVVW